MRIAIPLAEGKLAVHFGHCQTFALLDVNDSDKSITGREDIVPPPHQPGLLPPWLADKGVTLVIAGGMGQRAINLFEERSIHVMVGAPVESPEDLVTAYLNGSLVAGSNGCDH